MILPWIIAQYMARKMNGLLPRGFNLLSRKTRPWTGFVIGIAATALVQSSSVTTSLAIPLLAAGVLSLAQVYAALSYYHENREEIEAAFEEDRRIAEEIERDRSEYFAKRSAR